MEMEIIPTVDLSQSYQKKKSRLLLDPEVNGEWGRGEGRSSKRMEGFRQTGLIK